MMFGKHPRQLFSDLRPAQIGLASLLLLLPVRPSAAVEGTLTAARDNSLFEHPDGAESNGSGAHLFVGRTSQGLIRRALVFFDVAGSIPDGSTIESVKLTMNMSKTAGGVETVRLHRALSDWGEGESDADQQEGRGAVAGTGDATWRHAFSSDVFWDTPGGDFVFNPSAELDVGGDGSYTWEATAEMATDVQGWLDDPSSNFGWMLIGNESGTTTDKRFDSREHDVDANRPVLTIVFDLTAVDDVSWGMVKLEAR